MASFILLFSCIKEKSIENPISASSSGTLKSTSGDCLASVSNGIFKTGIALAAASNYIDIQVSVTKTGHYLITTDTLNGFSFKAEGAFTTVGLNTIRLIGSGKPQNAQTNTFHFTYNSDICSIDIPVIDSHAPPAVFTVSGAPGACTSPVLSGTYQAGVPLNAGNTIALKLDVTTAGSYTLQTDVVNGISFSATGNLAVGLGQTVILSGAGTPTSQGTFVLTPQFGSSSCTFPLVVDVAPPVAAGVYTCKIDGVFMAFNDRSNFSTDDGFGGIQLQLDGYTAPPNGGDVPELQIFVVNNNNKSVTAGTYNVDGYAYGAATGYKIEIDYHAVNPDQSVIIWNTSSSLLSANPPFTVTVTSATATRVKGSFSGTLTNTLQGSTTKKNVTEGTFDLPVQ